MKLSVVNSKKSNRLNVHSYYQRPYVLGYSISGKALLRPIVEVAPTPLSTPVDLIPRLTFWQKIKLWFRKIFKFL